MTKRLALVPKRERAKAASRYELLLKIAMGATSTVYLARRTDSSRLVAVKRAHPHLLDDEVARRTLLDEARLASRFRHANVASVNDVEETEDDLLLVMDYVEGASLAELLEESTESERPLPPPVAVRIALDVCAGLAAVHELVDDEGRPLGIVHRDVSPQNVLVGLDGSSRLTDFGLARLALGRDASRTTSAVQGKLAYVAPEVVDGKRCDARSEIFALGVVVWEALANRRLFRGSTEADTLRRVLSTSAPRLSEVAPHIGRHLDDVLAKALEKLPAAPHPTARAFAEALERAARPHGLIGTSSEVGAAVEELVGETLTQRRELLKSTLGGVQAEDSGDGDSSFGETASMLHLPMLAPSLIRGRAPVRVNDEEEVEDAANDDALDADAERDDDEEDDDEGEDDDETELIDGALRPLGPLVRARAPMRPAPSSPAPSSLARSAPVFPSHPEDSSYSEPATRRVPGYYRLLLKLRRQWPPKPAVAAGAVGAVLLFGIVIALVASSGSEPTPTVATFTFKAEPAPTPTIPPAAPTTAAPAATPAPTPTTVSVDSLDDGDPHRTEPPAPRLRPRPAPPVDTSGGKPPPNPYRTKPR